MAEKRPDRKIPPNPYAPSREALIDRQIREAQEAGDFDNLPHHGERLTLEDDSAAGEWGLAFRMLKSANFAPPWIEADKEVRALLARRDSLLERATRSSAITRQRDRDELAQIIRSANAVIVRLNHEAPTARQHRRLLDPDAELAALDRVHQGDS
jgi:hypothetical protein